MIKRYLMTAAALALAGCAAVGPNYRAPSPVVPSSWYQVGADGGVARGVAAGDLGRWWRGFDDPLLSDLVEQALRAGLDVRVAQARLRDARARRTVAGAGRFPGATASGAASRTESGGATRDVFRAGFDASWELDVFGGVRRGIEAADADLESTQASLHNAQVSLVAEVALNYVEVRAFQTRLGIARENLAMQSETRQLTAWRAQAGLVSNQDVEQARSNLEQTRAQIPSLETGLAEAEHRLAILLGAAPGSLHDRLATSRGLPALPAQVAVGIPADTLRQRPDVRTAERKLAAETARVGQAEAARYPSFNLSGSIGLEALTLGALGSDPTRTSSLLAGISGPIFDGGRLRAQVEIQDALREQALANYEQTVLSALEEVENALVALSRNREREQALVNATEASRNAALLARDRYSAGLIDFQSVLDTQRSVLSVEDSLASTRADGVSTLVRLYKALGGGWTPEDHPVNSKEPS